MRLMSRACPFSISGLRVFAILCLLATWPLPLLAHGGGVPQITRATAGSYLVYVWSNPESPRAGESLHVTVGVTMANADGSEVPITDAAVRIHARNSSGSVLDFTAEPGAAAGGVYYEADLLLDAGEWVLDVEILPPVGGVQGGTVSFPVQVQVAAGTRGWMVGLGAVSLTAGLVLYAVAIARSRRKAAGTTA